MTLEERIALGEDSTLELKAVSIPGKRVARPDAKDVADEFAAANASGTTFVFGVDDKSHSVVGIAQEKLDIAETWVRDICNDSVKPWVIKDPTELRKRKFDGIFSNDLIEHLTDPIRDLEDMKRLLKPGGEMVHCSGCYEYAFEYTRFHLVFFTGESLGRVAEAIGLGYELSDRLFDYSPA